MDFKSLWDEFIANTPEQPISTEQLDRLYRLCGRVYHESRFANRRSKHLVMHLALNRLKLMIAHSPDYGRPQDAPNYWMYLEEPMQEKMRELVEARRRADGAFAVEEIQSQIADLAWDISLASEEREQMVRLQAARVQRFGVNRPEIDLPGLEEALLPEPEITEFTDYQSLQERFQLHNIDEPVPPEQLEDLYALRQRMEIESEISFWLDPTLADDIRNDMEYPPLIQRLYNLINLSAVPTARWVWENKTLPIQELIQELKNGLLQDPENKDYITQIRYLRMRLGHMEQGYMEQPWEWWNLPIYRLYAEDIVALHPVNIAVINPADIEPFYPDDDEDNYIPDRTAAIAALLTPIPIAQLPENEDGICSICRVAFGVDWEDKEDLDHMPSILPCTHIFGTPCVTSWLREETTCPLCRKDFKKELFPEDDIPHFHLPH